MERLTSLIKVTHTRLDFDLSHFTTHTLYSHATLPLETLVLGNPGQINKHYVSAVPFQI